MDVATETLTLRDLREQSRLRIHQITAKALEVDDKFPTTHVGYLGLEECGTRDYWKIKALATVFGRSEEDMAAILKPKK